MRNMLRTIALSGSLALATQALLAQDLDTWALNREVLNSAANYTGVLTTAHSQVRKYITWDWNTSLDKEKQQIRTDALLAEIAKSQQINTDPQARTVPTLKTDVLNSYDVRFRYCDNMLLSYFNDTDFKHGLSARQIIDAPVLRAQRAGRTFTRDQLGRIVDDPTEGGVMMLQTNGGRQTIPACMGTEYDGALADGTVAYMTSAVRKLGPREDLSPRTETRSEVCPTAYTDGPKTLTQTREVGRDWRFKGSPYLQDFPALWEAVTEIKAAWEDSDNGCYHLVDTPPTPFSTVCPSGQSGKVYYQGDITVLGRDYHSAAKRDIPPTYAWHIVSRTCYTPAPRPTWTRDRCAGVYSEKALDRLGCYNNGGGNSGGSGPNEGCTDCDRNGDAPDAEGGGGY